MERRQAIYMNVFRITIVVVWIAIVSVTIKALVSPGLSGGSVFFTDFGQPWRAQINGDFVIHLILVMAWIAYRETTPARKGLLSVLVVLGSVYLLPYIFFATYTAGGRFDVLLLGRRARSGSD